MKRNIIPIILGSLIIILVNSCSKEDAKPIVSADFNVTYMSDLQSTIYPSMIFGLSEIEIQQGKPMDYFSVIVTPNIQSNIKIVVQESTLNYETEITQNNVQGSTKITPSLKWKYDNLKTLSQPGTVDITFICYNNDNNKELGRENLKLNYRAINECVLVAKLDGQVVPMQWMIAEYINEDSPVIDSFLQKVLQSTNLGSFTGYQQGVNGVLNQVQAIFLTLRSQGVQYSNITTTSNTNSNIASQYIRFSDEVLNNTQANCADGTVFFCSVLRKIGIHAVMILIPGHVYIGYYADDAKTTFYLLETTMVGSTSTFVDASNYQINNYNSYVNKLTNSDYFDGYLAIDVDGARKIIKPIGR